MAVVAFGIRRNTQEAEEAPLLRVQVGKPARGFKSLFLRSILSAKTTGDSSSFCIFKVNLWIISCKNTIYSAEMEIEKKLKKLVKNGWHWQKRVVLWLSWLVRDSKNKRKIKKFLTKRNGFDKISKLSREKNDRNLDNWTIDNNPWKFLWREISKNGSYEPTDSKKGRIS